MSSASDLEIIEFARRSDRVCVTLDHDFHASLATTKSERPSVILLHVQGLTAETLAQTIKGCGSRVKKPSKQALRLPQMGVLSGSATYRCAREFLNPAVLSD